MVNYMPFEFTYLTHLIDPTRKIEPATSIPVYCQDEPIITGAWVDGADASHAASPRIGDVTCPECIEAVKTGGVRR